MASTTRMQALEAQLQELIDKQTAMENENITLRTQMDDIRSTQRETTETSTTVSSSGRHEPKVSSPEYFSGQRNKVTTFITQVRMVIGLQPSRFPTENSKVLYAGSYLRDTAFLWFQPYVAAETPPAWLNDFNLFCKELRSMFGDPDEVATAERQLYSLRQRGSASAYVADFTRYAAVVNWNDEALCAQFYRGLKDPIKDELARSSKPKDLKAYKDIAVRIDTRLFERHLEKDRATKTYSTTYNTRSPYRQASPAITTTRATTTTSFRPRTSTPERDHLSAVVSTIRGRISREEYERRRKHNLCLYCGQSGHVVAKCPVAPPYRPSSKSNHKRFSSDNYNKQGKA